MEGERLTEIESEYDNRAKSYKLTHQGIKEIEQSMQKPKEPTEHFPAPANMNFYFNAQGATVQTGAQSTANITQNIGVDFSDILGLLEQLKPQVIELPLEQQEDALVSIEVLEDELKSQDKNPKRIRGLLAGLGGIAQGTVTFASQVAVLAQQLKNLGVL